MSLLALLLFSNSTVVVCFGLNCSVCRLAFRAVNLKFEEKELNPLLNLKKSK